MIKTSYEIGAGATLAQFLAWLEAVMAITGLSHRRHGNVVTVTSASDAHEEVGPPD